jgi:CRISPR system Cascade subunit CasC
MSDFLQLHLLTSYPPSNLNRDDLGRPKTAVMGGVKRLRISSQSLKRAWRTSDLFKHALAGRIGTRTKELGSRVLGDLRELGLPEKTARGAAEKIAGIFGKLKAQKRGGKDEVETEQLVHLSPEELAATAALVEILGAERREPTEAELLLLQKDHRAVDIALFGRMLAAVPDYNVEAAAQVAHALSVHRVEVEDDYWSAVDDLNTGEADRGAGHIGETEFAAGLFYLYLCIDRDLLAANLGGDGELVSTTLRALVEAAAKVAPVGKQASFASRAYASYVLAEKGDQQPRSLSVAFLTPVEGGDYLGESVARLAALREKLDRAYGPTAEASYLLDVASGEGSFAGLLDFVSTAASTAAGAPLAGGA